MTFLASALAIDGAQLSSSQFRRGLFDAMNSMEGIIQRTDLKVTQLATPGNGLLISAGNAVINNRYQSPITYEAYGVGNPDAHTIDSASMPTSQPSAKSYLVLITVGDPEFSQVGHPWMPSSIDPELKPTYQYVRPWILEVPAGTTSFVGLGLNYPAYALARVDIPISTTTITNGMITDLRAMARARTSEELFITTTSANNDLGTIAPSTEQFPREPYTVKIPSWATTAKITGFVEAMYYNGAVQAFLSINMPGVGSGAFVPIDKSAPVGTDRIGVNLAATLNVASFAGTSQTLEIRSKANTSYGNRLHTDSLTSKSLRVRFEEAPV